MDKKKGFIRKTRQRELILEILRGTDTHPTADWIYEQAKEEMPNISLGTVYRNLRMLKDSGEIIELSYDCRHSRFDGNAENHYHFVCTKCDKVVDIKGCPVDKTLDKRVEKANDIEVHYHRTEFYGLCADCKEKKQNKDS